VISLLEHNGVNRCCGMLKPPRDAHFPAAAEPVRSGCMGRDGSAGANAMNWQWRVGTGRIEMFHATPESGEVYAHKGDQLPLREPRRGDPPQRSCRKALTPPHRVADGACGFADR
jgi:hypothetical protein